MDWAKLGFEFRKRKRRRRRKKRRIGKKRRSFGRERKGEGLSLFQALAMRGKEQMRVADAEMGF